jgi:DNA-binding transcriptional MerR regulator
MRIGELARAMGVTADTIRFYEKEGWLPGPRRGLNSYREYGPDDVEHIRLMLDLRALGVSLADASRLASWCHSGHCSDTTQALPTLLAAQRRSVAERIERLRELDDRLARLERRLRGSTRPGLPILPAGAPCCDAAAAIGSAGSDRACCASPVGVALS